MANIFSGSEIVEMGVQIETNGRDFYSALTKYSKNKKAKGIFEYLATEEQKHIAAFKDILSSVERYQPPEAYPGEYFAYMNALAREYVFTQKDKGKETAKAVKTYRQAADLGIGFEKDSIIFYEGMKRVVPQHDHKMIEQLIAEEQGHLRQLSELKAAL